LEKKDEFNENSSSGSGVVPFGRTHRDDKVNSRLWQFCERAQKLNVSENATVSIFGWNVGRWWTAGVGLLESDSPESIFQSGVMTLSKKYQW